MGRVDVSGHGKLNFEEFAVIAEIAVWPLPLAAAVAAYSSATYSSAAICSDSPSVFGNTF